LLENSTMPWGISIMHWGISIMHWGISIMRWSHDPYFNIMSLHSFVVSHHLPSYYSA